MSRDATNPSGSISRSSFLWSVQRFGSTLYLRRFPVMELSVLLPCGVGAPPCRIVSLIRACAAAQPTGPDLNTPLHLNGLRRTLWSSLAA